MSKGSDAPRLRLAEGIPPQAKQTRSVQKRERILAAARTAFEEFGYERAQVDEIAARAGIATGAFYLSFRSKRQLLVELMNELIATLQSLPLSLDDNEDSRRALQTVLRSALRADRESYGVIRAWLEAIDADHELSGMNERIQAWTRGRVGRVFELVLAKSSRRRPRDLEVFTRIMDRHLWMLLSRLGSMSEADFDSEVRVTADMIHLYLLGAS